MKINLYRLFFLFSFSCNHQDMGTPPVLVSCNNLLGSCGSIKDVPYCTFGYKFGNSNPYTPNGPFIPGPKIMAGQISYKFQEPGVMFKTIYQNSAISLQFSENDKSKIRAIISEWSNVARFDFIEKDAGENTDITIVSAFTPVSIGGVNVVCGLGHPALNENPCNQVSGLLVINPKCNQMEAVALHEMGHVLGLGHVASENVMNPNRLGIFSELQSGDILGVQSIYGSK